MDLHKKAQAKVLKEIMDLMDEYGSERLRSKDPKFAKVDIQSDDPALAEELKDKLVDGMSEDSSSMEKPIDSSEEEDMEKLKELYERLK